MAAYELETMISGKEIEERIKVLGKQITEEYNGLDVMIVGVLKGAWIFMADLVRSIQLPLEVNFISVSSYVGAKTKTSGTVRLICDIDKPLSNKHVILVEDIVDTGLTLNYLKRTLMVRNPSSLKICSLLDKPSRRLADINADYCGFTIPDEFVVGYGLDYNGMFRNLQDICKLKIN